MNTSDEQTLIQNSEVIKYLDDLVGQKVDEKVGAVQLQVQEAIECLQANKPQTDNNASIVVFSGDMDRMLAAFVIATGAAAMGMDVSMYFAFWGLTAIKKKTIYKGKTIIEKMLGIMLPSGPHNVSTSKMNMMGFGPAFFKYIMEKKNIQSLPELIKLAHEMEVKLVACEMSMDVMGVAPEELLDGVELGGVACYLEDASKSTITLFI